MELVILIFVAVIIGLLILITFFITTFAMSRRKTNIRQAASPPKTARQFVSPPKITPQVNARECPTCKTIYTDKSLNFCLLDGDLLKNSTGSRTRYDPDATIVR